MFVNLSKKNLNKNNSQYFFLIVITSALAAQIDQ